jgi:UDP-N-acetylglucosamine:LPS N-acetylglucosamine transferase
MKVLIILGDGGHTKQILKLVELLGNKYDYLYLMEKEDQTSAGKIQFPGPIYRVNRPRRKGSENVVFAIFRLLRCALQEFVVALRVRPNVVLSMGAGMAVPVSLFGRLMGAKVIHVETASRVFSLSATGKIMYRIAHLFLVQWETHLANYPRAIYAGRLL